MYTYSKNDDDDDDDKYDKTFLNVPSGNFIAKTESFFCKYVDNKYT